MLKVYNPTMKHFPYEESKKLYEEKQSEIGDDQTFDEVIRNTVYFAFTEDDKLLGGIYFYENGSKIFVNVFANRNTHLSNLTCFKWSLNGFDKPIYAKTTHRHVRIQLLRLGFKKIDENLYKYERIK